MRLIEEKNLIVTEILLGIIIIASILLQITDSKIKDFQDNILVSQLLRSDYLQLAGYHRQRVEDHELVRILTQIGSSLGKNFKIERDSVAKEEDVAKEYKELMTRYEKGEIDASTYLIQRSDIHREKAEYYKGRIKQMKNNMDNIVRNRPQLFFFDVFLLKRCCLAIQLLLSCFVLVLLTRLHARINKRTINKKQKD